MPTPVAVTISTTIRFRKNLLEPLLHQSGINVVGILIPHLFLKSLRGGLASVLGGGDPPSGGVGGDRPVVAELALSVLHVRRG